MFGFFHKDEKDELIKSIHERKKKLLKRVKHLFSAERKIKRLADLENHILESTEKLDPSEKAAVDKVLDENRTEEQIIDYLAMIEKEVISLIESGNTEAIKTRLKKYIYAIEQLANRLRNLQMTKKAQMVRIKEEEERLEKEALGKAAKEMADKKKAFVLMRQSLRVEKEENRVARKRFYRSITKLGTNSSKLLSELLKITAEAAKIAKNVGRVGVASSDLLARKLEAALKKK